jgi:DNA-binding NarL/FixJ family response regulator
MQPGCFGAASGLSARRAVRLALIDAPLFSHECLLRAFEQAKPKFDILAFAGLTDCLSADGLDADLILYVAHQNDSEGAILNAVASMRHAFVDIPIVVLWDAPDAQEPKSIRRALRSGAQGFIPTRTTSFPTMLAAINFVRAGGTFVPVDAVLASRPEAPPPPQMGQAERLTSRQLAVLSHLQQGKANKLIAYELGMSESTVKCHVRTIMRKMGATNRTQAVYKAQALCGHRPAHASDF